MTVNRGIVRLFNGVLIFLMLGLHACSIYEVYYTCYDCSVVINGKKETQIVCDDAYNDIDDWRADGWTCVQR